MSEEPKTPPATATEPLGAKAAETLPEETLYIAELGALQRSGDKDMAQVSYLREGVFDYQTYRRIQTEGNKRKLGAVFVQEPMIRDLAAYAEAGGPVTRILCHGTRNAAEQGFFKAALPGVSVLGTEISDTAMQFPDTVQWDFHEMNPDWAGAFDLVYSNSWDHSYDPAKAFATWALCVRPGGLLALEHTKAHQARRVNALDPFGTNVPKLIELVETLPGMVHETTRVFGEKPRWRRLVLFRKAPATAAPA